MKKVITNEVIKMVIEEDRDEDDESTDKSCYSGIIDRSIKSIELHEKNKEVNNIALVDTIHKMLMTEGLMHEILIQRLHQLEREYK